MTWLNGILFDVKKEDVKKEEENVKLEVGSAL